MFSAMVGEVDSYAEYNIFLDDPLFTKIMDDSMTAIIEDGIFPERIPQGSSGSYFVYNSSRVKSIF